MAILQTRPVESRAKRSRLLNLAVIAIVTATCGGCCTWFRKIDLRFTDVATGEPVADTLVQVYFPVMMFSLGEGLYSSNQSRETNEAGIFTAAVPLGRPSWARLLRPGFAPVQQKIHEWSLGISPLDIPVRWKPSD